MTLNSLLTERTVCDVFLEVHISKLLTNFRAMLHDPQEYPEPEKFLPERFIKDGKINPEVLDPSKIAFGFGRR